MFSPMSAGEDVWPQHPSRRQQQQQPPTSNSALGWTRPRSPNPPRGGPPDRVLATGQRVGDFFGFSSSSSHLSSSAPHNSSSTAGGIFGGASKSKGKQKAQSKLAAPGGFATTLEPTGWNQPQSFQQKSGLTGTRAKLSADGPRLRPFGEPNDPNWRRKDVIVPSSGSHLSIRGQRSDSGRRWYMDLFRPTKEKVEKVLDNWYSRQAVLCLLPCFIVWFWCAVPFPKSTPDEPGSPWCDATPEAPWCRGQNSQDIAGQTERPRPEDTDANFWFFLLFYYGLYAAVALVYVTQLFSLYRLNWWPSKLGAKTSYSIFWLLSISAGYVLHRFRFDSLMAAPGSLQEGSAGLVQLGSVVMVKTLSLGTSTIHVLATLARQTLSDDGGYGNDPDDIQWQRKTLWVGLAFATMAMPALVCLIGLRRSGRQTYRHSLTDTQKAFLERQLAKRIPASYIRFLWFISTIGLSLVALLAGQGYASVYLSTLPHTGLDGTAYVTFWMTTVNLLAIISHWILEEKVRSRALLFANKYYYFLVYFIFYRNLFARLRSFDQFALVQLLSSFWVCIWYPFSMTPLCHRIVCSFTPSGSNAKSWEEYVESVALAFYVRNLAQNVTMVAFLGWVTILHFHGQNHHLYPFFAFSDRSDPYNYQLTMLGSGAIWASELITSFIARALCKCALGVDVTNLGLDEMRQYPDLLPTVVWTSVHVCMDMLLFLIKLNFR